MTIKVGDLVEHKWDKTRERLSKNAEPFDIEMWKQHANVYSYGVGIVTQISKTGATTFSARVSFAGRQKDVWMDFDELTLINKSS